VFISETVLAFVNDSSEFVLIYSR